MTHRGLEPVSSPAYGGPGAGYSSSMNLFAPL